MMGRSKEVQAFNELLGRLPHKHKVAIAGNHELTFDLRHRSANGYEHPKRHLTNCHYLEDDSVEVNSLNSQRDMVEFKEKVQFSTDLLRNNLAIRYVKATCCLA